MEKVTAVRGGGSLAAKRIVCWLLMAVCLTGIFLLSSQPGEVSNNLSTGIIEKGTQIAPGVQEKPNIRWWRVNAYFRGIAHIVVFSLLALFLTLALTTQNIRHPYLTAAVFCILYAGFDELYQGYWIIGRGMEFMDILRDWCGSLPVILLSCLTKKQRTRRRQAAKKLINEVKV